MQNGRRIREEAKHLHPQRTGAESDDSSAGAPGSNLQKDPDEWVTGEEPMTAAQASYLKTLSDETGEAFDETLTKADASKRIDELRQKSPRVAG